jgi:very-short-patch-repair endonuclease
MRPERVLIELASIYKSPDFIEKVLHVMRRKRLVTYTSTREVFDRLAKRGRPGIRVTRIVLERWDPEEKPAESVPETALLQILRNAGIGRVVPQLEIFDSAGRFIARPDVALPDSRIAVEYDSDAEHTDEMSLARDNARRNRLLAAGWIVVTARNTDVRNGGDQVVAAVRAHHARPQLA